MADVVTHSSLRLLAQLYHIRAANDAPFGPLPLADHAPEGDEITLKARKRDFTYEMPTGKWRALPCQGESLYPPRRFIDGSLFSRMVAILTVEGRMRPAVLGCIGALALEMDGRRLVRSADSLRLETVLCLLSNGMQSDHLETLRHDLDARGIRLVPLETTEPIADIEVLRKRCWDSVKQQMEDAERAILLKHPDVPALVDGLLERRLTTVPTQNIPAIGMVKTQMKQYLPNSHLGLLYDLKPAERTPAFLYETEHASIISWYLRLSGADTLSPSYGLVRLAAMQSYLEQRFPSKAARWAEISALSHWVYNLRHREGSYPRAGISLEPIVRVEDELHALLPDIDQQAQRLHRALGI